MLTTPRRFRADALILLLPIAALILGCDCGISVQPESKPTTSGPSASQPKQPSATLPNWEPDPALLDKLEPYRDIGDYQIRLPKGWEETPFPGSIPFSKTLVMVGPMHEDGMRLTFMVTITTYPPGSPDSGYTPEKELKEIINGFNPSLGIVDFQQNSIETGKIGDLVFVRNKWQGSIAGVHGKGHGSHYLTKDARAGVWIVFFDKEPYHEESLKLVAAAVMTLRKKQEKPQK